CALTWLSKQNDEPLILAIIGALTPSEMREERTSDPAHAASWGAIVSTVGRELDNWLIKRASLPDRGCGGALLANVMAARSDNPAIRKIVLEWLANGDSDCQLAIMRVRPNLTE